MSNEELFVYDTGKPAEQPQKAKTFQLISPDRPEMSMVLPEFDFSNPPVDPNEFASTLVDTCIENGGLGLSANQCGYNHRVFVMGTGENFICCFNPKVISSEGEAHLPEGCLSFPLLQLHITRAKTIVVEYQDWTGQKHTNTFTGLTARIFLHELDHLNGIVYTDRAKPLAFQSGLKRIEKMKRKYFNVNKLKKLNGQKTRNA